MEIKTTQELAEALRHVHDNIDSFTPDELAELDTILEAFAASSCGSPQGTEEVEIAAYRDKLLTGLISSVDKTRMAAVTAAENLASMALRMLRKWGHKAQQLEAQIALVTEKERECAELRAQLACKVMTFTVNTEALSCTVTADNVEVARTLIHRETGIMVQNKDLVPLVTRTRHVRALRIGEETV